MHFWLYLAVSTALFGCAVVGAMTTYTNYFSALVGLSDTVVGVSIVINFALSLTLLWTRLVIAVFLNSLTMSEMQSIYQRGWIFLCNSLLYWGTVNGDLYMNPFNLGVCLLSILVIFVLHWVCRNRVRGLQAVADPQLTVKRILTISRLGALCLALFAADVLLCYTAVQSFRQHNYALLLFGLFIIDQLEMSISFCSEFAINSASLVYLHLNPDEDDWEPAKLLTTVFRLLSSTIAIAGHGLFIYVFGIRISDMGSVLGRLMRLFHNVKLSTKAATARNEIMTFTTVPDQAVLDHDNTCVICREEMSLAASGNPKMAPRQLHCGHAMHGKCLVAWISQSATCPTCRSPVRGPPKDQVPAEEPRPNEPVIEVNEVVEVDEVVEAVNEAVDRPDEQPLHELLEEMAGELVEEPMAEGPADESPVEELAEEPAEALAGEATGDISTLPTQMPRLFVPVDTPIPFEASTEAASPANETTASNQAESSSHNPSSVQYRTLPSRTLPLLDLTGLSQTCDPTVSDVGSRVMLGSLFEVQMQ